MRRLAVLVSGFATAFLLEKLGLQRTQVPMPAPAGICRISVWRSFHPQQPYIVSPTFGPPRPRAPAFDLGDLPDELEPREMVLGHPPVKPELKLEPNPG